MKKTVLLIDDFANTLFVTGFTLEQKGYQILKATSGMEALQILKSGAQVDLIITDYNMPGMNGLQLVTEIKKISKYANIPIFILSTETKEEVKQAAQKAGITLWISKPFKADKLIDYVNRAIN